MNLSKSLIINLDIILHSYTQTWHALNPILSKITKARLRNPAQ